jgi:hypothetical protein
MSNRNCLYFIRSSIVLDWDETEPREIVDSSASMPIGWLESELPMIADPEAVKPSDW